MIQHYKPRIIQTNSYGKIYTCNHPVYSCCTLYLIHDLGLAVIQQRYDQNTKHTWWEQIDAILVDDIYLNENFYDLFLKYAKEPVDDIYPTLSVRQVMHALKMKPLKREPWETVFDKKPI